jgi:glycosyltransferase involved in cell wall biosynthesis
MNHNSPLVSIIIPVHNRASIVGAAIDSVICQDIDDWELIVVDDHSDDDIRNVVDNYGDQRIRLERLSARGGAAAARNRGIGLARGTFIALLDSDDQWLPKTLGERIGFLKDQPPDVFLATAGTIRTYASSGKSEVRIPRDLDTVADALYGCTVSPGTTLLIKREVVDWVGYFDETLERLEDWDWLLTYLQIGRLKVFPKPAAKVNVAPRPVYASVRSAGAKLRQKHGRNLRRLDRTFPLRLASGVRTEEAMAAYASGRKVLAALTLLWSLCLWPPRAGEVVRRLVRFGRSRSTV